MSCECSLEQSSPAAPETKLPRRADRFRQRMRSRIAQLLEVGEEEKEDHHDDWTDVSFLLEDGTHLDCHQLILKMASPYFEAKFGRLWNRKSEAPLSSSRLKPRVRVDSVRSETFRLMVEFIYKSGSLDKTMLTKEQLWQLLEVGDMYLLPGLVEFCVRKLSDHLAYAAGEQELVAMLKQAQRLSVFEQVCLNLII